MRGDKVEVVFGTDAGKQGVVRSVLRNRNKVIVEGVNMVCPRACGASHVAVTWNTLPASPLRQEDHGGRGRHVLH